MARWYTVPDFFPDYDDLSAAERYHLAEGYCIHGYETKKSGKFYKKIKTRNDRDFRELLNFMDLYDWHLRYKLRRNLFGFGFKRWVEITSK